MKKILTLLLMLFTFQHLSLSQDQHLIDSLQSLLQTAKKDTNKANILNELSIAYWYCNSDKAMDYANQTLVLSEQIGFQKGIAGAYISMGTIVSEKGDYISALAYHNKSLKISEKNGLKKGIADSYNKIGTVYDEQGNYPEALKYYYASLKINEEIRYKKMQGVNYQNIGRIYHFQGNYPAALKHYFAGLKVSEEEGNKTCIAGCYQGIGVIYVIQGNYAEALKNFFAALRIQEETGEKRGIAYSHNFIGYIYGEQGNRPEELKHYLAALKIFEEIGNKKGIIQSSTYIADHYFSKKKYIDAAKYLNKGISLAKEIGDLDGIMSGYLSLAALDSAQGNCTKSLAHYKMYIITRDSLFNMAKTKKIMQMEVDKKEELAKAEQENKDALALKEIQKQKWVRNGFIGGFTIVLLFAGVFLRQRIKIKREKQKSDAERKRSEELLLNILPSQVAEEIKQTGHCQAKTFSMVSVMFMDFKDFTSVSERVSAELLVDEINTCFSAFDGIIQKYKVEKIKTVGDAYICVGGLPVLNQTHAQDIIHAATEMQGFMLARKKEKEEKDEFAFEMRIGIHTGPVVAGIVGVRKFQYDIWGDTVNLAARMEQNSDAGKINISGSKYKLVKDKFNCVYRGKIEAKNKGEVEMYFVENI